MYLKSCIYSVRYFNNNWIIFLWHFEALLHIRYIDLESHIISTVNDKTGVDSIKTYQNSVADHSTFAFYEIFRHISAILRFPISYFLRCPFRVISYDTAWANIDLPLVLSCIVAKCLLARGSPFPNYQLVYGILLYNLEQASTLFDTKSACQSL